MAAQTSARCACGRGRCEGCFLLLLYLRPLFPPARCRVPARVAQYSPGASGAPFGPACWRARPPCNAGNSTLNTMLHSTTQRNEFGGPYSLLPPCCATAGAADALHLFWAVCPSSLLCPRQCLAAAVHRHSSHFACLALYLPCFCALGASYRLCFVSCTQALCCNPFVSCLLWKCSTSIMKQ